MNLHFVTVYLTEFLFVLVFDEPTLRFDWFDFLFIRESSFSTRCNEPKAESRKTVFFVLVFDEPSLHYDLLFALCSLLFALCDIYSSSEDHGSLFTVTHPFPISHFQSPIFKNSFSSLFCRSIK